TATATATVTAASGRSAAVGGRDGAACGSARAATQSAGTAPPLAAGVMGAVADAGDLGTPPSATDTSCRAARLVRLARHTGGSGPTPPGGSRSETVADATGQPADATDPRGGRRHAGPGRAP
ncbi:MAG: hypothetical protein ABIS47_10525, partial [Acidimicrobiales bacterium]